MKINDTHLVDLEVEEEDAITSEKKLIIDNLQIAKAHKKQRNSNKNKGTMIAKSNKMRKQQFKMMNKLNQINKS